MYFEKGEFNNNDKEEKTEDQRILNRGKRSRRERSETRIGENIIDNGPEHRDSRKYSAPHSSDL